MLLLIQLYIIGYCYPTKDYHYHCHGVAGALTATVLATASQFIDATTNSGNRAVLVLPHLFLY